MKLLFDIETDGLLDTLTKVHCIALMDVDTRVVLTFDPTSIEQGLKALMEADELIGHNIMGFDIPALLKVYPDFKPPKKLTDTLVLSRLIWPNLRELDFKKEKIPRKSFGSHSLEAWGYRLKCHKGDFGQDTDWSEFTPEMLEYCTQDIWVNKTLLDAINKKEFSHDAIRLEHDIHRICLEQERLGFPFEEQKAAALYSRLSARREELKAQLQEQFEPNVIQLKTKTKVVPFNPASRQQIADRLMKRGWKPEEETDSGQPKVDESALAKIDLPEAKLLLEFLMLNKRIGQLAEGANAWLKLSKQGRIHGRVTTMGAVTSRATHQSPNLAQIPSLRAAYGKECRELFHAPIGWEIMGSDMSGIELRCLAHYMARFDKGKYADIILNGDIHTANQKAAALPTRDHAKTFIYALLYGAGAAKIGSIVGQGVKGGSGLKKRFLSNLPALAKLQKAVEGKASQEGYLTGLDKRTIPVRSPHSALNTLLQCAGALLAKQWVVEFHNVAKEQGYDHGKDYQQVAWVHDEIQILVPKGKGDIFGKISQTAIERAGEHYKFRIRLDTEYNIGSSWAETH